MSEMASPSTELEIARQEYTPLFNNLDDGNLPLSKLLVDLYKGNVTGVVHRAARSEFVPDKASDSPMRSLGTSRRASRVYSIHHLCRHSVAEFCLSSRSNPRSQDTDNSLDSDMTSADAAPTEVGADAMFRGVIRAQEKSLHSWSVRAANALAVLIHPLGAQLPTVGAQLGAQIMVMGAQLGAQFTTQSEKIDALANEVKELRKLMVERIGGDPRGAKRSRVMQQPDQQTNDLVQAQLNDQEVEEKALPRAVEQVQGDRGQNERRANHSNQRSTQLTGRQQPSQFGSNGERDVEIMNPGYLRAIEEEIAAFLRGR